MCGMRIDPSSRWRSGGLDAAGATLTFDTPACLFRYRLMQRRGEVREPWVIEHYGPPAQRVDARRVRFALGSDQTGPMGPDLVPVDPARAADFAREHHARQTLAYEEVTAATLDNL